VPDLGCRLGRLEVSEGVIYVIYIALHKNKLVELERIPLTSVVRLHTLVGDMPHITRGGWQTSAAGAQR
jgi:hypothetical protein